MARCFVIQPFDDGGPYDKRYKDVLLPAIKDADLEPYRVDEDRSSSIPIDDIEQNIRGSEICLADITLDNANIWYEVGFAFANNKPVVMICAKPRPTKPPFDVQHRHIIFYTQDSPSDFKKLQTEVTERLKAKMEKAATMQTVASLSPVKTDGLSSYEIAAMVSIMENRLSPEEGETPADLKKDMRRAGYTDVATSLSVVSLDRKGLIECKQMKGESVEGFYTYPVYALTALGLDWMLENQHRFKLQADDKLEADDDTPTVSDEDIPF
jgi:nucleoside 2-deoxyribosyltransferase